jgi:hypothetical protein
MSEKRPSRAALHWHKQGLNSYKKQDSIELLAIKVTEASTLDLFPDPGIARTLKHEKTVEMTGRALKPTPTGVLVGDNDRYALLIFDAVIFLK